MPVDLTGTNPIAQAPGVHVKAGAILNDAMVSYAAQLRQRTGFDIVITSGIRTPAAQAAALAQDYNFAIYKQHDLVAELVANGPRPTAAEMAAVLQAQINRGRFLSRHMRADAIDLRVRGYTGAERAALEAHARALGGNVEDEGDHIHVGGVTGVLAQLQHVATAAASMATTTATTAAMAIGLPRWFAPFVIAAAALGALFTGIAILLSRRRRR